MKHYKFFISVLIIFLIIVVVAIISSIYINGRDEGLKIGFPYIFYWEFQVRNSDFKNFSWSLVELIHDLLIYLIISLSIVTFFKLPNLKRIRSNKKQN